MSNEKERWITINGTHVKLQKGETKKQAVNRFVEEKTKSRSSNAKPSIKMSYKTLLKLPDSYDKFVVLGNKLMKLQHHGNDFFEAQKEHQRLYKIYNAEYMKRLISAMNKKKR